MDRLEYHETAEYPVTVDLDEPSGLDILTCYYRLVRYGETHVRLSSSGKGIHMRCKARGLTKQQILDLRSFVGDDRLRVFYDTEAENKPFGILFEVKNGKESGEWTSDVYEAIDEYQHNINGGMIP